MPLYAVTYTVTGNSRFPLDMLRYDSSHPATSGDVAVLDDALEAERLVVRTITLRHVGPSGKWMPTAERWKSFLWLMEPGSIRVQRL